MNLSNLFSISNLVDIFQRPALREPRFPVRQSSGLYSLKTLTNNRELRAALALRHDVFLKEMQNKSRPSGLEYDQLDRVSDHLGIFYQPTQQIVGTYRVLFSDDVASFYSESQFELESIRNLPEKKLELGRACIHKDHRNGAVLQLLWRGIATTMAAYGARYLLGCSSVPSLNEDAVYQMANDLTARGYTLEQDDIHPKPSYFRAPQNIRTTLLRLKASQKRSEPSLRIPPLLMMYLKAGAKISKTPAFDPEFGCADFFTILDREALAVSVRERFFTSHDLRQSTQNYQDSVSCA